ncbi:MAG: Ig-like domain-containing protein [Deltaproteobacteria bacterium]|jgi:hypothetical protein|nr:Ig-like domain-containing protein [Deltaproteobacteria bacterium]MCL5879992.1 Ig-like domain-containing protein [Deltaproteobacteria bacterium]MDA8304394.1 Ig-like domain-containing protein [Deltaproteobacteria bacterium]
MGSIFSPPAVTHTSPQNGATGVSRTAVIRASFNEAMSPLTFNSDTVLLIAPSGRRVAGKVYYDSHSLTSYIVSFTPDSPLSPHTTYAAELTTAIEANLNDHLGKTYTWSFTTR